MTTTRSLFLATSGFTQGLVLPGTVLAQNVFNDQLCQVSQLDEAACDDNGCAAQGGRCTPMIGVTPNGDEVQGCICQGQNQPQNQCQVVFDHHTGASFCADLSCPPLEQYNCDPVSCTCGMNNEFGDQHCQPSQMDPRVCVDFDCAALGGRCLRVEAQFPNGGDHEGCHCEFPSQSGPLGGCEIVFDHKTGAAICADLDCGDPELYECNPANCSCLCDTAIPPEVKNQRWPSGPTKKVKHAWDPVPCAIVYNVYRQPSPLVNCGGGVACSYGACQWSGLVAHNAMDAATPLPGNLFYYMITGEDLPGEGTLGPASSGLIRPNVSPCPTPPPNP